VTSGPGPPGGSLSCHRAQTRWWPSPGSAPLLSLTSVLILIPAGIGRVPTAALPLAGPWRLTGAPAEGASAKMAPEMPPTPRVPREQGPGCGWDLRHSGLADLTLAASQFVILDTAGRTGSLEWPREVGVSEVKDPRAAMATELQLGSARAKALGRGRSGPPKQWKGSGFCSRTHHRLLCKMGLGSGCWWLTPVIPATQEAEIGRIAVQSQPRANNSRDPTSKKSNTTKSWWSGSSGRAPA
jgi:hypothetical protein